MALIGLNRSATKNPGRGSRHTPYAHINGYTVYTFEPWHTK